MKIRYLTLFKNLIEPYFADSFMSKALKKNVLEIEFINIRDFSNNNYKSVDVAPYGGGDGMILRADVADKLFSSFKCDQKHEQSHNQNYEQSHNKQSSSKKKINIYLSPQGVPLNQQLVKKLVDNYDELNLLCGRYGGVDQRVIDQHIDLEVSLGDFVLSGGELAALALTEAIVRYLPGVLGDENSVINDSHTDGFLEAPQYGAPDILNDNEVPIVLKSGHHQEIALWKFHMSCLVTYIKRKDLFEKNFDLFFKSHSKSLKLSALKLKEKHLVFVQEVVVKDKQKLFKYNFCETEYTSDFVSRVDHL